MMDPDVLTNLLSQYTERPFVVFSDPFPEGYFPRPVLPLSRRSLSKKKDERIWCPVKNLNIDVADWYLNGNCNEIVLYKVEETYRNRLNRLNSGTAGGEFAPFTETRITYEYPSNRKNTLDIYVSLDSDMLTLNDLKDSLCKLGKTGYGSGISRGNGKFDLISCEESFPVKNDIETKSFITLAKSYPAKGVAIRNEASFYNTTTVIGRMGDMGVYWGTPAKKPLVMMQTGALITTNEVYPNHYYGMGLKHSTDHLGKKDIPPYIFQQGYAPVLPVRYQHKSENA